MNYGQHFAHMRTVAESGQCQGLVGEAATMLSTTRTVVTSSHLSLPVMAMLAM